jgi:hypothetical protein
MAISAEQLNVILSARDREFTRAMDRAQRRVQTFASKTNSSLLAAGKGFKMLSSQASAFIPALSAAIVVQQVRRVVSELDQIGKKADAIGLTTDALQELRVIAEEAGVAQESLDNSLMQFSKRLGEARQGTGAAKNALEELNLTAAELSRMPLDQALQTVADRMTEVESATARSALATQLFGRQGVGMLNMLRLGADGMEAARENARALGIVIDEDLIRNAEAAENQLGLMARVINANLSQALINLAPLLVGAAEQLATITRSINQFYGAVDEAEQRSRKVNALGQELSQLNAVIAEAEISGGAVLVDEFNMGQSITNLETARARVAEIVAEIESLRQPSGNAMDLGEIITSPEADLSALQDRVDAEKELARLAGMTAENRERARIASEAEAAVREAIAGQELTAEELAQVDTLRQEYIAAAEAASSILNPMKAVGGATKAAGNAAKEAAEKYEEMLLKILQTSPALQALGFDTEKLKSTMQLVESSMEDAFMSMIDGTMSAKDAFRSMAASIIRELFRVLVVQRLVGGITTALGFPSAAPVPALAAGGPVRAGQPHVVGEHGRELFVPQTAGRVLSVAQAQNAVGGGGTVVVNQTINVSTGVQQTVRAEIKQLMPQIAESAKAAVVDAKRRGGTYGRAFA